MGNCSVKAIDDSEVGKCVRLVTNSGSIIELKGPKLAQDVLVGNPGYGIFKRGNAFSPLSSHDYLISGQFYYLYPLQSMPLLCDNGVAGQIREIGSMRKENTLPDEIHGSVTGHESPKVLAGAGLDVGMDEVNRRGVQVLPSQGNGVWKVKLVIDPKQLEEILSGEGNTEALIEKMRMAAAATNTITPRRSKSFWGVPWKPCMSNVFKVSPVDIGANKN